MVVKPTIPSPTHCKFVNQRLHCLCVASLAFVLLIATQSCSAEDRKYCPPSSCGNIRNISYPFRLVTDQPDCGELKYNLSCENNQTLLNLFNGKYKVQAINYNNFTIRLVDLNVDENNCSSLPQFPLWRNNFSHKGEPYTWYQKDYYYYDDHLMESMILISCPNPVKSVSGVYINSSHCINGTNSSKSTHGNQYSYVNIGGMSASYLMDSCGVHMLALLPYRNYTSMSFIDLHRELAFGFELSWHNAYCMNCADRCYVNIEGQVQCTEYPLGIINIIKDIFRYYIAEAWFWLQTFTSLALLHVAIMFCLAPCMFSFLIYKFRRRHRSAYDTVEDFLHNHNNLMPIRYSYSDVKKMTGKFKDKLGEGGFGSVYKGKLRSGNLAAIKMLGKSKSNGQDFINEVATIGRIHHTNVVRLIGFCAEGSKRALVYDFMPNGSLDRHIFAKEGSVSLSWENLYEISLGIARGIEYLHRGCDMQILHFDIKPHNILLDENFSPKLSDFGLAKLYPTTNSIVSVTAARGTIGYMAPELFYKNIGSISYKADVYSFGMMLLEITGKRKNLNAMAENTSQTYFPFWVYDQLAKEKFPEIIDGTEEENKTIKKMIIVGLWCIQMRPTNRPSMSKVIEMLEGNLESLQLPPRPLLYPEETPVPNNNSAESISSSDDAY